MRKALGLAPRDGLLMFDRALIIVHLQSQRTGLSRRPRCHMLAREENPALMETGKSILQTRILRP